MKNIIPSLAVADVAASIRFYTDVLDFQVAFTLPGENGKLMHGSIQRGDSIIMFSPLSDSDPHDRGPLGQGVVLYSTVADDEDIDAYFERVRKAGATIIQEPADQFWGHRDWAVTDPDGYRIYVSKVIADVSAEEMREAALAGSPAD
jgi:uncharacterized glyoxalase superfamily protein PhnB